MSIHLQVVSGAQGVTFTAPNKFSFKLPTQFVVGPDNRISLKSLRMYYSWFNLTSAKNNNSFSYVWSNGTTYPVVMQDGVWSFADAQAFLQQTMQANGHYLLNAAGQPVYYIQLQANSVFYRLSLTLTPVPAVLPTGWTAPTGWVAPATDTVPLLIVPATAIQTYLGFPAGTYPAVTQALTYQINSPNVPQVTDISSLMLQSTCVKNEYGPDARTIASFVVPPGQQPGTVISEVPFYQDWIPMQPNVKLNVLELTLVDQNSNPVKIEDIAGFICTLNIE